LLRQQLNLTLQTAGFEPLVPKQIMPKAEQPASAGDIGASSKTKIIAEAPPSETISEDAASVKKGRRRQASKAVPSEKRSPW
jgi:hypothetical protein